MTNSTITGIVRPHKGNGRKFGYPTANIPCDADLDEGVFVGYTSLSLGELQYVNTPSIIFVGAPSTLHETNKRLETHLLDIPDTDLYGAMVVVHIAEKLRTNQTFESIEKLIEQMKQDEVDAREWFEKQS